MSKNTVYFVAGATIGALAGWYFAKQKYEKLANEEIQSVTDAFNERLGKYARSSVDDPNIRPTSEEPEDHTRRPGDRDIIDYAQILAKQGYTDYTKYGKDEAPAEEVVESDTSDETTTEPVLIAPDDYGEIPEYEQLSWVYFFDRVLTDDDYSIIPTEMRNKYIGKDAMQMYGEYEDDAVHFRNDALKCYVEVVQDSRLYASVVAEKNS